MAAEEGDGEEEKAIVVGAGDTAEEEAVAGADEEDQMYGGWDGGGGGGDGMFIPPGFRFMPTEDEMIRYYLLPKLQGRAHVSNNAIIEDTVYQCNPDELTCKYMDRGEGRSFYFLSPRERKCKNGVRPRQDTKDRLGRWKASTGKSKEGGGGGDDDDVRKEEKVAGDGTTKYCKSGLAYFYFRGRGEKEKKSGWLMKELTIPEYEIKLPAKGGPGGPTLDRYAMCKIYPAPRSKTKGNDDDEAGPSNAEQVESDGEGETAELPPKLSEKQAGKRPVEYQQLPSPAAAKKKKRARHSKRLQIEPPAPPPPQGDSMQAPFGMLEYYDGSWQPMGYQAGEPTPLPLVPYNNGQVHSPRQQVAYNGQVPMMTPQPAAYNRQMLPVTQQQVAFNGQVRLPPYRHVGTPNNQGQNQTMMTRPSCPAGQAVNPQMQKQPETIEMLKMQYLLTQSEIHPAQQQQRQMAFTQQQQAMAFTQQQQQEQQQQQAMALMMHQQQQWTMALMMHQQQSYLEANADCHPYAGGESPQFPLDDFYASMAAEHYERSRAVPPATGGSPGEAAPVKAEGLPDSTVVPAGGSGGGNNGNHDRAESAAVKASPGGSASAEGEMAPNTVRLGDRCSIL